MMKRIPSRLRTSARWLLVLTSAICFIQCQSDIAPGVYIAEDEVQKLTISDKAEVWLQPKSELTVESTKGDKIIMDLKGRMYLDAEEDNGSEIIMKLGPYKGTSQSGSFAFNSDPDKNESPIHVIEGSMVAQRDGGNRIIMEEGQLLYYDGEQLDVYTTKDVVNPHSWSDGKLEYTNISIRRAANDLGRHFGVLVLVSQEIMDCRVTLNWQSASLKKVMEDIEKLTPFTVERGKGETYLITGLAC